MFWIVPSGKDPDPAALEKRTRDAANVRANAAVKSWKITAPVLCLIFLLAAQIPENHPILNGLVQRGPIRLKIAPVGILTNGQVTVSCDIKNTGDRAGDEVAQLFFHQEISSVTTYESNLCGFERVTLQPGETKRVSFTVPASALELINRQGQRLVEPGTFTIMVGSSPVDIRLGGSFDVILGA